jgi:hypothetical protein
MFPGMPGRPGEGSGGGSQSSSPRPTRKPTRPEPPSSSGGEPTGLVVRAYGAYGELLDFDPVTGSVRAIDAAQRAAEGRQVGVYRTVGSSAVVFYRDGDALRLRIDNAVHDLDRASVRAEWADDDSGARLTLFDGGVRLAELRYPRVAADFDLGLLVHRVLADPTRRGQIFRPAAGAMALRGR